MSKGCLERSPRHSCGEMPWQSCTCGSGFVPPFPLLAAALPPALAQVVVLAVVLAVAQVVVLAVVLAAGQDASCKKR